MTDLLFCDQCHELVESGDDLRNFLNFINSLRVTQPPLTAKDFRIPEGQTRHILAHGTLCQGTPEINQHLGGPQDTRPNSVSTGLKPHEVRRLYDLLKFICS